ncbi:MAG: glycosyltransferase family 2 protein [Nevskiales bacterium]
MAELTPLISVILPTYNRAHLLPRAIGSVLAQSYRNLELIVADDASTDRTAEVVNAIRDARVRYLRCPRNGGPGYARNRGIEQARGDYIAFQDSDDVWLPHKLALQMQALQAAPVPTGMVCVAYSVRFADGGEKQVGTEIDPVRCDVEQLLLAGFTYIPPTWLLRRECLADAGMFDEHLPNREDWELVFRIFPRWELSILPELGVIKYETAGSIEGNWRGRIESYRSILERYAPRWSGHPALQAIHYADIAEAHLRLGEHAQARAALAEALRLRPWAFKDRLLWCVLGLGPHAYERLRSLYGRLLRLTRRS